MKKLFILLVLPISFMVMAQNTDIPIKEKIKNFKEERARIAKIHKELGKEWENIRKIKDNCEEVNTQAKEVLIGNVKKISGKGLYNLLTAIESSVNPLVFGAQLVKMGMDEYMERKISSAGGDYFTQDVVLRDIRENMEQVINKDHNLYRDIYLINYIMTLEIDYFDQHNRTLPDNHPRLEPFWKGLNYNSKDPVVEKSFRKTHILIKVSKDAENSVLNLMEKIAQDRRRLDDWIKWIDRKIIELGGQLDPWDYTPDAAPNNLEQPKITGRTNQVSRNDDAYKYRECLNPRTGEGPRSAEERNKRTELLKMYYENGYRFDTYIKVNFLDEVTLGQKIPLENYAIKYANPHIQNPEGVYRYSHECFVDGVKSSNYPFTELANMNSGRPGKHIVTVVLKSCDDIIQEYEHEVIVKNPIFDATIYFKDPESEVSRGRAYIASFNPEIDHPSIEDAEIKLANYTCYVYFDDDHLTVMEKKPNLIFDPLGTYTPGEELLTLGKHEIRIELWDNHTHTFVDQYLHHVTVTENSGTPFIPPQLQKPTAEAKNYGQIKEETYDPELEGKREPILRLQWANYDYVFGNGKVKIDGFYYWNNQKVMYTSEPILNYVEGAKNVPGMVLTATSGYHIYPTTGSSGACTNFIITQMKGAEIKILHRLSACDFNYKINTDKTISISYRSSPAGSIETITLL